MPQSAAALQPARWFRVHVAVAGVRTRARSTTHHHKDGEREKRFRHGVTTLRRGRADLSTRFPTDRSSDTSRQPSCEAPADAVARPNPLSVHQRSRDRDRASTKCRVRRRHVGCSSTRRQPRRTDENLLVLALAGACGNDVDVANRCGDKDARCRDRCAAAVRARSSAAAGCA